MLLSVREGAIACSTGKSLLVFNAGEI